MKPPPHPDPLPARGERENAGARPHEVSHGRISRVVVIVLGGVPAGFIAWSLGFPERRVKRSGSDTWPRRWVPPRAAAALDGPYDSVQHEAAKLEPSAAMNSPAPSVPAAGMHGAA